jgi:hypothetical protein
VIQLYTSLRKCRRWQTKGNRVHLQHEVFVAAA